MGRRNGIETSGGSAKVWWFGVMISGPLRGMCSRTVKDEPEIRPGQGVDAGAKQVDDGSPGARHAP